MIAAGLLLALAAVEPRPIGVFVVPEPRVTVPLVRALLPKTRDLELAGFDPLDVAALEKNGIDPSSPIYVWIGDPRAPWVVELAVAKPAQVDAAIAAAIAAKKKVVFPRKAGGMFVGDETRPRYVVVRRDLSLYVQVAHPRSQAIDAIAIAANGTKPKTVPRIAKGANAWLTLRGEEGIERVDAGFWLSSGRIEARAEAWLDMTGGLLAGDLAGGNSPGRRMIERFAPAFAKREVAAEVVAKIGTKGVPEMLDLPKLKPDNLRILNGEVHVQLTRAGDVIAALGLYKDITKERAEELRKSLEGDAKLVEDDGEKAIVVVFPGNPGVTSKAAAVRPAPKKMIDAYVAPPMLFEAFGNRARAKDALQMSRSEVAAAELELGDFAKRVTSAELALGMPPGSIEATIVIEYR